MTFRRPVWFRWRRLSTHIPVRHSYPSVFLSRHPDTDSSPILNNAFIDTQTLVSDVKQALVPVPASFCDLVRYQFDAGGKLLRPLLVTLVAACANIHANSPGEISFEDDPLFGLYRNRKLGHTVSPSQHRIAMITEMIHTASLIHDDLLDSANLRRGKKTVYKRFGHKQAILGGDFVLTHSSRLLAEIGDTEIIVVLSQVIADLIHGELLQLTTEADDTRRFQAYLDKTYRKTASLMANSCKAAVMLTRPKLSQELIDCFYEFGRHFGMAFQLIDDVLDFVADEKNLGKPGGGADLQTGVATGPVLFAAQSFPELDEILLRQFGLEGDKERALELVEKSDGIGQTRMLAEFHFQAAQRCLTRFRDSPSRKALLHVAAKCLQRNN
ncbi:Decaprenyl-diphosphate synthase subunit 1 [Clonorchis sinensis]|uniref:Decaprenyl-diphosphate synthase subunit 1 n=1 Tax=Clonorchis sinensis TaxID=79923 RepID=A0A8T1MFK8_CLOSI|nr:Decaprenyl-diphosphate synthase subunit 1 [Clonorchis sinensis]